VLAVLALPRGSGGRWVRPAAAAVSAAGLLAAGTAVALAGTGSLDAHGMIAIPALHDAANDRPIRFSPVCSKTPIPVCLHPAYARYLPAVATALAPVLSEMAALPGAPARISQAAATYQQGSGNAVGVGLRGPFISGRPPVYHLLLPDQLLGPAMTTRQLANEVRSSAGPDIVASVIGDGPGASQAQHAVVAAVMIAAGLPLQGLPAGTPLAASSRPAPSRDARCERPAKCASPALRTAGAPDQPAPEVALGSPAYAAALRFAALPASTQRTWLVHHLAALRAGRITLAELP
jgi:hypothetical protein